MNDNTQKNRMYGSDDINSEKAFPTDLERTEMYGSEMSSRTLAYGAMRDEFPSDSSLADNSFSHNAQAGSYNPAAQNSIAHQNAVNTTMYNQSEDIFTSAGVRVDGLHAHNDRDDYSYSASGFDGGNGMATTPAKKHKVLWFFLGFFILLIAAAIGGFFVANAFFSDHVAPGVHLGKYDLVGKSATQIRNFVQDKIENSHIVLADDEGHSNTAKLSDLGVSVDLDKTVNAIMSAKQRDPWYERLNPFKQANVVAHIEKRDTAQMEDYVVAKFMKKEDQAVPASIHFDEKQKVFVATEGKTGKAPVYKPIVQAIDQVLDGESHSPRTTFSYQTVDTPISKGMAQKVADEANARLKNPLVISNGDGRTYTLPTPQVVSWIKTNEDTHKGTLTLDFDSQAIHSFIDQKLPQELNQKMVTQQDYVNKDGSVILSATKGVDGVQLTNTGQVADKVVEALQNSQPLNFAAPANITKHDVKKTVITTRIVVDKTNQIVTVYQDDKAVKVFNVCTGRIGKHDTDDGVYPIYLRYKVQDMRGLNDDGSHYFAPGVKWVSYFDGGEAFHTATWNYQGIAKGDPAHYGSHGCVNMYEQDAHWIFDHCPKGTIVQVIGSTPSGPVR